MFAFLFNNCTKLSGDIPSNLFGDLYGNYADGLFNFTFYNTKLSGNLPPDIINSETNTKHSGLFGNLSGTPQRCMFRKTFSNNVNITGIIPAKIFGNPEGVPAPHMFDQTFDGCTNLSVDMSSISYSPYCNIILIKFFLEVFYRDFTKVEY